MTLQANKNTVVRVIAIALLLSLTACGGGNKKSKTAEANVPVDMTKPPVVITGAERGEAESNPDETVSFEKWKDEREAKAKAKEKAKDE